MKKAFASFFVAALIILGSGSLPVETLGATADTQASLEMIKKLTQQIQELQSRISAVKQEREVSVANLITSLKQGSKGDGVRTLQALLAADPEIYPEGMITGVYGK